MTSITNSAGGVILGDIVLTGAASTVVNSSTISGNVVSGLAMNYGTINGTVSGNSYANRLMN